MPALAQDERVRGERTPKPAWADVVERAVAATTPGILPSTGRWQESVIVPLQPFLTGVRDRLAEGARDCLPLSHADPDRLADAYTAVLGRQLVRLAVRTMTGELDRARAGNAPTGWQRRTDFLARLCTPAGLTAFFEEYPVLARLLGTVSESAAGAGLELLTRFATDRSGVVEALLGGTDPGPVVAIEPGLGDRHRQGRTAAAVLFADGRKVIYKPRTIAAHVLFRQIADWLNRRVPAASLRTVSAVSGPGYGWLEFIASQPLARSGSAADFYRRVGVLLAALYATHASHVHSGNLIASGETPILVDVETLFHPALSAPGTTDPAAEALAASVHRAGLLPRMSVDENGAPAWSGIGGREIPFPAAGSHPYFDGTAFGPADHEAAVLEGFRLGYDAIAAEREAFTRLIESCGDLETRAIVRPAGEYARLLDESARPDLLRDARDRDRALDALRETPAQYPMLSQLARYELADLRDGDIPLLTSRPSSRDIWASAGQRLPGLLSRPGLGCALDTIAAMGEVDRRDQEWVISASLATRRPDGGHLSAQPVLGTVTATAAEPGRLLAAACGLADQIVAHCMTSGNETDRGPVNWLGLKLTEDTRWMVLPMGASLADGYLGVALFLAQLARLTGIGRYAEVARRAIIPVPRFLATLDGRPGLIAAVGSGGISGLGGISYGLARMSGLLHDPELGEWAAAAVELAAAAESLSDRPGWAAGSAGCLAAMISVQAELGSGQAGKLARTCADRLTELVEHTGGQCVVGGDEVPAGFAAGPAGVAWALARLAVSSAEPRYLAAGRRAARRAGEPIAMPRGQRSYGWCSGAAGLLLASTCLPGDISADEVRPAVRVLAERPVLGNLSLCHGELGIAEALIILVTDARSTAAYRARRHRAGLILDAVSRHAPFCGTPGRVSTPGLLNGLAGIGYGLLRLGFADRVPSVLLLEPTPPSARSHAPVSQHRDV